MSIENLSRNETRSLVEDRPKQDGADIQVAVSRRAASSTGAQPFRRSRLWISLQPRYLPASRYARFLQLLLLLLIVIGIACLGSLPIASRTSMQNTTQAPPVPFIDGTCTATPESIQYIPLQVSGQQSTASRLPSIWFAAGRTEQDFAYARACAATFVAYYESFDAQHLKTLEAAVSMLSEAAKQRFYLGGPHTKPDSHMDPQWRQNLQQQMIKQNASVGLPALKDMHNANGKLVIQLDVPYQIILQKNGGGPVINKGLMLVQLNAIPPDPQNGGTGWNVESWQDDT